jgi:extradiol dioxygenase family protein
MGEEVTAIMLGVHDLARSKRFYGQVWAARSTRTIPNVVSFNPGEGSSLLALYQWEAAAQDAGVSSVGSGFRACRSSTSSRRAKLWTRL